MPNVFGTREPVYDDRAKFFFIRLFMKFGMKNPYEVKKDALSPDFLKDKALEIRSVRSRYDSCVRQIRYLVGDLEALWQNDIQTSFLAELGNIQERLMDYADGMAQFASFLEFAAQELSADPEAVKRFAAWSEENDEPIEFTLPVIPNLNRHRDGGADDGPFGIPGMIKYAPDRDLADVLLGLLRKIGLVRREEITRVQHLLQGLKRSTLELRSVIIQFNFNVKKMDYIVSDLDKVWRNDTQTLLVKELEDKENAITDFSNIIEEYATLLEMAVEELETNKIDIDRTSVLSEGQEGPVSLVLSSIPYLKRSRIDLKAYDPYFESTQAGVSTEITATRKNSEYIYNVYSDHIELVKYIGMYRTVQVPAEIDGLPVTHIGLDCFAMAWRVRFISITIPESVTTIYHGAFRNCQYIREINLPRSLKYIGNYAFAFISDLEHITIPEGVVSLGMGAFRNCDHLREIVIPDSTLRIGNDCFYCCRNLASVTIGDSVIDIDDWAFRMSEHLANVRIGENVINIGTSAFYDDVLLMRLDIPGKVAKIGENAFYHRRGMTLGVIPGSAAERYVRENDLKFVTI